MGYTLTFLKSAKKEWDKLSPPIKNQLKIKLAKRLLEPGIPKAKLAGMADNYKIKLKTSGYRLVYKVIQDRVIVQVIAIARRDKEDVYKLAQSRLT